MSGFAWFGLVVSIASAATDNFVSGAEPKVIGGWTVRGPDARRVELRAPADGATVLVFYSSECPISNAYSPELNRLAAEFPADRVRFVGVCVDPDLSNADVVAHLKDFGFKFPVVRDRHGKLARQLGASVTPEAFVLDPQRKVRYHGRIDDQFADRRKPNANRSSHELRDAVAAVLAGGKVAVEHVEAVGCPIPEPTAAAGVPTYAGQVARILQKNCQECHREGQVGPFPLETFEQARKRAPDIATVVEDRVMPPWKPAPGIGRKFKHDRTLAAADITALVAWAEADAPLGDPAKLPSPIVYNDDWALGTPDLVVTPAEDFAIPAEGPDIYRCFVVPTNLPKDVYISAVEYLPGNRRVVHHMLAYVDVSGEARKKDAVDPGPGYSCFSGPEVEIHGDLGGWAPGNEPSRLPEGVGRALPKGGDVIIQVHYHPDGKAETDRSRIGLHFARKPIKQTLHWSAAAKLDLVLPPGERNIEAKARWPVPVDLVAYAVTPHMHLLGRDMLMSVKYPDGRTQDLVKIDDWDFAWQNTYYFESPLDLPKGSELTIVAHFDNSSGNPRNPNHPPKEVKWGEATTDEMCIGFVAVTKKGQDLTRPDEKDDLHDIFVKQREEGRKRYEAEAKKRAAEAKAKGKAKPPAGK
jgi:thiol-disulfide isomerase/thioredoxin/mono/diheme cytochrome c family protein